MGPRLGLLALEQAGREPRLLVRHMLGQLMASQYQGQNRT